jgi:hypothetical protein
MDQNKPEKLPGDGEPVEGSRKLHVTTIDELANMAPIEATGEPPQLPKAESVFTVLSSERPELEVKQVSRDRWSVYVKPSSSRLQLGLPVDSVERIGTQELHRLSEKIPVHEGYRPPWLRGQYLPRIIPRRAPAPVQPFLDLDFGIQAGLHEGQLTTAGLVYAELADRNWPWCTVGQISVSIPGQNGRLGSGVLVGPNLILTASHAVPWDAPAGWSMLFTPSFRATDPNPAPFGSSWVEQVRGHLTEENDVNANDYVIAKLHTPLGNSVGWMGSQSFGNDNDYEGPSWMSVGYPGLSGVPFWAPDIKIDDVDSSGGGRELETGEFLMGGWSGGPLLGFLGLEPKVIGIASGNEPELSIGWFHVTETNSVFAGGSHMVDLVKYGYANWPV